MASLSFSLAILAIIFLSCYLTMYLCFKKLAQLAQQNGMHHAIVDLNLKKSLFPAIASM